MPHRTSDERWGLSNGLSWVCMLAAKKDISIAIVYPDENILDAIMPLPGDPANYYSDHTIWDFSVGNYEIYPRKGGYTTDRDYALLNENSVVYMVHVDKFPRSDSAEYEPPFDAIWWVGFQENPPAMKKALAISNRLNDRGIHPPLIFVT